MTLVAENPPYDLTQDPGIAPLILDPSQRRRERQAQLRVLPKVLGVRGVDASNLILIDLDLGACQFAGAHHLDKLRFEGPAAFADTPRGWQLTGWLPLGLDHRLKGLHRVGGWPAVWRWIWWHLTWWWPPVWRWSRRQVLMEERVWRDAVGRGAMRPGWLPPNDVGVAMLKQGSAQPPTVLSPERIAGLYRQLRKAYEDAKNEPGAADFYYGEMEKRRHAAVRPRAERVILWAYWLVSGYGLRAWRALAALAVLIGLVGVAFSQVGFHHPHPSMAVSWLYALQATVSLEGKARQLSGQLTLPGELLRVGLRLTGPVLLGLAVLSIRGRVKR
jgi:hypothetical protein